MQVVMFISSKQNSRLGNKCIYSLFRPTPVQIGSSPGFEDGEFESAKLMCPAASFYNAAEGCLYFVDSEVRT